MVMYIKEITKGIGITLTVTAPEVTNIQALQLTKDNSSIDRITIVSKSIGEASTEEGQEEEEGVKSKIDHLLF